MSLSAWEQQTLDSIKDGLVGSDPQLAALLTTFTRLASGEEMPVQEKILDRSRRRRSRPMRGRLNLQLVVLLLFLVSSVVLITVVLLMSHSGGQGKCTGSWPTICSHSAPG